jgi:hypothetical protein
MPSGLPLQNCYDCNNPDPANAVGLPDCPPSSEPCEDLLYSDCVKYTGPNLPTLGITNGMRLKTAFAALNVLLLGEDPIAKNHVITVTPVQGKATVEYLNKLGVITSITVTHLTSPQTICALISTPAIVSGSASISVTTVIC